MMTLDEAIKHAEEVADTCEYAASTYDYRQLAEWLKELKVYRETFPSRSLETYDGEDEA